MAQTDELEIRRRKLRFRSWHRGTREMDLIMGRFADVWLERFGDAELDDFERLIEVADPDLYAWITGSQPVPADYDTPVWRRLSAFHSGADVGG